MHEYRIAFPAHSRAAAFCAQELTEQQFLQLSSMPAEKIHVGCQVGKVYRIVAQEDAEVFTLLGVLLEYVAQPKKKSKQGGEKPLKSQRLDTVAPEQGS